MDRLSEMEAFVAVVDQGGFTDAARKMGISKSAISKHIAALEQRLAVRLLNRTTRRVNPTEIGLVYYDKAKAVLRDAEDADAAVMALQARPSGNLRITAPVDFAPHLSAPVAAFLGEYPEISVNMVLDNRFVELVSEGFDVAIRIGQMSDSSLRVRKLAESRMGLIASPEYFARNGMPQRVEDLAAHTLLHYAYTASGQLWRLSSSTGEERQVRVGGRLTINDGASLLDAARSGLGIAYLPAFVYRDSLVTGDLVRCLEGWSTQNFGIHAVYPPGEFLQPKLRAFIDFMVRAFKEKGPENW